MPSIENLKQKQAIVEEIKEKLTNAKSAIVIDYMGINVAEANAMRKKLREADVEYFVYKNTMFNKAIADTDFEALSSILSGPSAFAFGYEDAVAPARVLNGIMKEFKKMSFKGGIVEGNFYDSEKVKEIALLPSREELIAKFMGSIQSPVSKMVRTLQAVADAKEA
jgi:large subunit ribosomal protein L10